MVSRLLLARDRHSEQNSKDGVKSTETLLFSLISLLCDYLSSMPSRPEYNRSLFILDFKSELYMGLLSLGRSVVSLGVKSSLISVRLRVTTFPNLIER